MSVLDILNQPWAITPAKLEAMYAVYERHASGATLDEAAIKAATGGYAKPDTGQAYSVQDGVAIIPVQGVLAKKMNLFTAISGGMSTELMTQAINDANADPTVHSILLSIDSPGGEVDGTQQVADAVKNSAKPTVASIDGMGASAAMWIAAQCDSIYAASDTTQVGSIAVVMTHTDRSKANEARGVNPTHVTTGKYKRILSGDKPLSQDGLNYAQDQVDYLHTLFVNAMADGRGVSTDTAADWADGKVWFAQQAVDNGLIDGIASEQDVIAKLVSADTATLFPGTAGSPSTTGATMSQPFRAFATESDLNTFVQAAEERGRASATVTQASVESARNEGVAAGAIAERDRINAIEALPLAANHSKLLTEMKKDPTVTAAVAATRILAAEGAAQTQAGADRKSEAQAPVEAGHADVKAEAGATRTKKEVGVHEYAGKLRAHIAKAAAEGRTINAAQADAELSAETK